jgi:hypothetical protein
VSESIISIIKKQSFTNDDLPQESLIGQEAIEISSADSFEVFMVDLVSAIQDVRRREALDLSLTPNEISLFDQAKSMFGD